MYRIENLLREAMGLDTASIGSSLIERTVRLRMKNHRLRELEDYRRLLETSPGEASATSCVMTRNAPEVCSTVVGSIMTLP